MIVEGARNWQVPFEVQSRCALEYRAARTKALRTDAFRQTRLILRFINTSQDGGTRHPRIRDCRCIVAPRVEFFAISAADRTFFFSLCRATHA
jgi:hypothetical protein